jgi:hypothetical protein
MLTEETGRPRTQRHFANDWEELAYLCRKIRYWLYKERRRDKAQRFLVRLEQVLRRLPKNGIAIVQEEGWALLHELKGQIRKAIPHRRREIDLMRRLHKEARSAKYADGTVAYMLQERNTSDLEERQAILETLMQENACESCQRSVPRRQG